MYSPDDTIVALATPPGRGGLAVVRLSGPRAVAVARALTADQAELEPRRATLVRVISGRVGGSGAAVPIDEAVSTFFPAGHSYTGEDVVELSLHGSPVVAAAVIETAVSLGARLARPGEFTLRAFLNGRLDLTRAEAVEDLVEATTPVQARVAFDQLQGGLAERIGEIERELFDVIARLEASGDFPEEGYHFISVDEARTAIGAVARRIDAVLADARRGRLVREGVSVAIVGRPNVGKSTLFNRLAGADRAIVTAVPGTTRDVLTEPVMLLGTRMLLADTAGVRHTNDPVEREGVERAEKAGAAADVVVIVIDGSEPLTDEDRRVLQAFAAGPVVIAVNKRDLPSAETMVGGEAYPENAASTTVRISARTGEGVDALVRAIAGTVGLGQQPETARISNVRHIELLSDARTSLLRAVQLVERIGQTPEEILLSDLRLASEALQEVTGKRTTAELLDAIFSRFCIGK